MIMKYLNTRLVSDAVARAAAGLYVWAIITPDSFDQE
jgi:hypothetical protein